MSRSVMNVKASKSCITWWHMLNNAAKIRRNQLFYVAELQSPTSIGVD